MVPDVISYSAAVSACERAGEWTQALQLLDEAHECGEVDEMTLCLGFAGVIFLVSNDE